MHAIMYKQFIQVLLFSLLLLLLLQVGEFRFYSDLFMVGLLYHLYNQFAFNTLQRVSPVSHGVCNVVKRVVIIFSSVLFFNQV